MNHQPPPYHWLSQTLLQSMIIEYKTDQSINMAYLSSSPLLLQPYLVSTIARTQKIAALIIKRFSLSSQIAPPLFEDSPVQWWLWWWSKTGILHHLCAMFFARALPFSIRMNIFYICVEFVYISFVPHLMLLRLLLPLLTRVAPFWPINLPVATHRGSRVANRDFLISPHRCGACSLREFT